LAPVRGKQLQAFLSPIALLRRQAIVAATQAQGLHSIERIGDQKSDNVCAPSLMLRVNPQAGGGKPNINCLPA
jgi:hypothetical protein